MQSKFYIGQKVVALNNSISDNTVIKGNVYKVLEIKKVCCFVCIRVDENLSKVSNNCIHHDTKTELNGKYYDQDAFAPIQEQQISSMTYEEAIELVTEKQLT